MSLSKLAPDYRRVHYGEIMIERFRAWVRWVLGIGWVYFGTSYERCADGHVYLVGHWHDTRTGKNRRFILNEADLDPFD